MYITKQTNLNSIALCSLALTLDRDKNLQPSKLINCVDIYYILAQCYEFDD